MRSIKQTVLAGIILLGMAAATQAADEADNKKKAEAPKELKNQTHCPVMGGAIDSSSYTDIQGQRVYHCCPMCTDALTDDPDKYFKEAAANGILYENIQTTCPVSGKELPNKSTFIDFEGRRVVFCCPNCIATFKEAPATYLKKLEGVAYGDAKKAKDHGHDHDEDSDHSGHSH